MIKKIIFFSVSFILILSVISPWITKDMAEEKVLQEFNNEWKDTIDGCGFNCNGCGIKESYRVPFGRLIKIEYACGMLPSDSPEYHQTKTIFVSFLQTTHDL